MPRTTTKKAKPFLQLVGQDGNAFAILGAALRAAKKAGWSEAQRDAYTSRAMSGDYQNLLAVTLEFFDVH